jgi:hypothetical protein
MPIPHEAANRSTTVDPAKWLGVLQRWHPRMPREELVGFINEFIDDLPGARSRCTHEPVGPR